MTTQLMSVVLLALGMAMAFGGVVTWFRVGEQLGALPRGDQSPLDLAVTRRVLAILRSWLLRKCFTNMIIYYSFLLCGLVTPALAGPILVNGNFEMNAGSFTAWPGYVGMMGNPAEIPGWTSHTGDVGINPGNIPADGNFGGSTPFRNNGLDITNVAFLQGNASLSQTIGDFTVGSMYSISFSYNSRNFGGNPNLTVEIFGADETEKNIAPVDPAGTFLTPYYKDSFTFTATAATGTLVISTGPVMPGTDTAALIDNIVLSTVPEPSSALLMGVGVVFLLGVSKVSELLCRKLSAVP